MVVFTRLAMSSSAIHCLLAIIVDKNVCKISCPVKFISLRLDESLTGMLNIFQEMFGEGFWKQTVMVFTKLSMKSSSKHSQLALIVN